MRTSKRVVRVVDTYLGLLDQMTVMPQDGLYQVYAYHSASGRRFVNRAAVKALLLESNANAAAELTSFAQHCIMINLASHAEWMIQLIQESVQRQQRVLAAAGARRAKPVYLTSTAVDALRRTMELMQQRHRTTPMGERDRLSTLAQAVTLDAVHRVPRDGRPNSDDAVLAFLALVPGWLAQPLADHRLRHLPLVRTLFNLWCVYEDTTPNEQRIGYEEPPITELCVSDTTLAALPLPSWALIRSCEEPEVGPISRPGLDYATAVQALLGPC